ncbi:MAG: hypothetical protein SGJ13_13580 [Actinomycetota bacterium]|nr:hypothetical protein [Actinomycetota bacterium]
MGVGTIPKNETSGTFTVAVKDDTAIERDDTLLIELRDPKDGLILDATAVATIVDKD